MTPDQTKHSPLSTWRHLDRATSHRRMVRSQEELAMRRPSGEKQPDFTGPEAEHMASSVSSPDPSSVVPTTTRPGPSWAQWVSVHPSGGHRPIQTPAASARSLPQLGSLAQA